MSEQISIIINGKQTNVLASLTLTEVLNDKNYTNQLVAIAINETFVSRDDYSKIIINANDCIDIVAPMQGG